MTGDGVNDAPNVGIVVSGGCNWAQSAWRLCCEIRVDSLVQTLRAVFCDSSEQSSTITTGRVQEEEVRRYFAMVN